MPTTDTTLSDAASAATGTAKTRPAPLWLRLAALVYDLVAVVAIVMVVGMICEAATLGKLQQMGTGGGTPTWYPLLQYLVVVAYFVASWLRGGQTLGMRPWRMYLYRSDGAPMHLPTAILRAAVVSLPLPLLALARVTSLSNAFYAVLAVWVVFFGVGLFDRRRRALHDIAADTEVVRIRPIRQKRRRRGEPG